MIWKQFQETRNEDTNLSRTSPVPTWTCALSVFSVFSVDQTLLDWPGLAAIPQWPESHPRCGFRCAPPLLSGTGGNWDWPPLTQVRKATETQRKAHADASSHSLRPFYLGTDCTMSRSGAKLGFNGSDFCSVVHTIAVDSVLRIPYFEPPGGVCQTQGSVKSGYEIIDRPDRRLPTALTVWRSWDVFNRQNWAGICKRGSRGMPRHG